MSYYTSVTTQTKDLSPQGAGIAEAAEITAFSAPHPHQTTPAPAQNDDEEEQTYAPLTQYDLTALLMELERTLSRGAGDARCILMTQSDILDSLFRALVGANLKDAIIAKF